MLQFTLPTFLVTIVALLYSVEEAIAQTTINSTDLLPATTGLQAQYQFRALSPEDNEALQIACENQEFINGANAQTKILNGTYAERGKYPWTVVLQRKIPYDDGWETFCGGTIVSKRHILTARHCLVFMVEQNMTVRVLVGGVCTRRDVSAKCESSDMKEAKIEFGAYRRPLFEGYDQFPMVLDRLARYNLMHDMALIQLAEDLVTQEVNATSDTHAACLPHPSAPLQGNFSVYGWGDTTAGKGNNGYGQTSNHLMEVELPLIRDDDPKLLSSYYKTSA